MRYYPYKHSLFYRYSLFLENPQMPFPTLFTPFSSLHNVNLQHFAWFANFLRFVYGSSHKMLSQTYYQWNRNHGNGRKYGNHAGRQFRIAFKFLGKHAQQSCRWRAGRDHRHQGHLAAGVQGITKCNRYQWDHRQPQHQRQPRPLILKGLTEICMAQLITHHDTWQRRVHICQILQRRHDQQRGP